MKCQEPPQQVNFKTLILPASPNTYLMAPQGYCQAQPHMTSPVFEVSIINLQKAWDRMISLQPRITKVASDPREYQYTYIQRTKWLRFPDTINVQLIALEGRSTLVLYSASKYGYYDFGMNQKRVHLWINQLKKLIDQGDN